MSAEEQKQRIEAEFLAITERILRDNGYEGPALTELNDEELTLLYQSLSDGVAMQIAKASEEHSMGELVGPMSLADAVGMTPVGRIWGAAKGLYTGVRAAPAAARAGTAAAGGLFGVAKRAPAWVRGMLPQRAVINAAGKGTSPISGMAAGATAGAARGRMATTGFQYGRLGTPGATPGAAAVGRTGAGAAGQRATRAAQGSPLWDPSNRIGRLLNAVRDAPLTGTKIRQSRAAWAAGVPAAAYGFSQVELPEGKEAAEDETYWGQGPRGAEAAIKELYWEHHTIDSANDKFMNWFLQNSVPVGGGMPGGTVLDDFETLGEYIENSGGGLTDIRNGPGREQLEKFLRENWQEVPALRMAIINAVGARGEAFQTAAAANNGIIPEDWGDPEAQLTGDDLDSLNQILFPADVMGPTLQPDAGYLSDLDEQYGAGSAGMAFGGVIEEAIAEYAETWTRGNPYMIQIGADMGGEGGFGAITDFVEKSYDGSPHGSIYSLRDAFSGEPGVLVGPAHVGSWLDQKEAETKEIGGGSLLIHQIQQNLYAMGYFDDVTEEFDTTYPGPDEWGYVDDQTKTAYARFQWDLIVNNRTIEDTTGVAPDINEVYEQMMIHGVRQQMTDERQTVDERTAFQNRMSRDLRGGIVDVLRNKGVTLTQRGENVYLDSVMEAIDQMTAPEKEFAWGQGARPEELKGIDQILAVFYGNNVNYGEDLMFGHNDIFVNYAHRANALTQTDIDGMSDFQGTPDRYADMKRRLGKDVARSNFMMFLETDLESASEDDIRRALIQYANTVGLGYAARNDIGPRELDDMAKSVYQQMRVTAPPGEEQLLNTLQGRVSNAMGVPDAGIPGGRYANLLNTMNRVGISRREPDF